MRPWTVSELDLAVRLTSNLGYSLAKSSTIMARHGYAGRTSDDLEKKLREDAPAAWASIESSRKSKSINVLCGVRTALPRRRIQKKNELLAQLICEIDKGLSAGQVCWIARLQGFNCNITDIVEAGRREEYKFLDEVYPGVIFSDAIINDLCLWPLDEGHACGKPREKNSYCGAHHCRALGPTNSR